MGAKLTERQKALVADIIESGKASLSKDSAPDYVAAMEFVFDCGVFFLPQEQQAALARDLRSADRLALQESPDAQS